MSNHHHHHHHHHYQQQQQQQQQQHRHPCDEFTSKVFQCHKQYGKQGEECVREELAQKKCFAQMLCHREARQFYDDKVVPIHKSNNYSKRKIWEWRSFNDNNSNVSDNSSGSNNNGSSRVSCATVMEVFAKPENELLIPEEGLTKEDYQHCRRITYNLASCLAKKRKGQRMYL